MIPVAVFSFAFAGWTACGIYGKDLLLPAPEAGPPLPDANTCNHAHYLGRPAADDPGQGPTASVVVALATLAFGESEAGPPALVGFDLDNVCTCPGPDSCVNTISSPHCDEDGGRDNAGGDLLDLISGFPGISQASLDDNLSHGTFGFLIQVRGWNGQPNDTQVSAAVYVSSGLVPLPDGGRANVKGDGTDVWQISSDAVLGGDALVGVDCGNDNTACSPVYLDDDAYVASGVLVCSLDFPIAVGSPTAGTVELDLTGSVITAPLTQVPGGWAIQNGVLDGRWATKSLLSSLAAIPDPLSTTGEFLCGTDSTYGIAKNQICSSSDIAADPKLDQTGAPCDAVSIAIGFTGLPAHMGPVTRRVLPAQGCTTEAGTPFSDSCNP